MLIVDPGLDPEQGFSTGLDGDSKLSTGLHAWFASPLGIM